MYQVVVYNKKEWADVQLSKNFKVREFACKDGSNVVLVDPLLVWLLQSVRDHFRKPVTITSGYRTVSYNSKLDNSAADSLHTYGMAADIVVSGVKASEVQTYLETIMPGTGGIGKAANYTHVDTRAVKARWTY